MSTDIEYREYINSIELFRSMLYKYTYQPYGVKDILKLKLNCGGNLRTQFDNYFNSHEKTIDKLILEKHNFLLDKQKSNIVFNGKKSVDIKLKAWKVNKCCYYKQLTCIKNYIIDKLSDYGEFIITGSMATADFVEEFSDVDIICFVYDSVFSSFSVFKEFRRLLLQLNGLLLTIDPLQNHGVFLFFEFEKKAYVESLIMPLCTIGKGAIVDKKGAVVTFHVIDDEECGKNKYVEYLDMVKNEIRTQKYNNRFFRDFLHRVYLLPCIYMQYLKKTCYKKESFKSIANEKSFKIVKELCLFYNTKYFEKRYYRWIPSVFFRKFPILLHFLLNLFYGKRQPKLLRSEMLYYVNEFSALVEGLRSNEF